VTPAQGVGPTVTEPLDDRERLELRIARLLVLGTYLGVALLAIGIVLMLASGVDPLTTPSVRFDPASIAGDLTALRATGFLWTGVLVLMALPVTRVAIAAVAFARSGDRRMAAIALAVLIVLAISVVLVQVEAA
jgi:uncharacterized membrane protein